MKTQKNNSTWALWQQLHNEPLFRQLRTTILILSIYSIIVVASNTFFEKIFDRMQVTNLGQFHLIFSFVMAILVGFRINTSYARWWEARGYWGQLTNNSRNLAFKFNNFIGLKNNLLFLGCLKNYPMILKLHLSKEQDKCMITSSELGLKCSPHDNIPDVITNSMYSIINRYRVEGVISLEQYLSLASHLVHIVDLQGGCEKISSTKTPVQFKLFVRQSLIFYMIIFPFGWVDSFGFLIIPIILVFVYILKGLEILAEDLEDPFDSDSITKSNLLPLNTITTNITAYIDSIANFTR